MNCSKKEKLMSAALELFAEQGFRGTSTAEIAQKAGVATGTLFHHFPTKEALINDLYREIKRDLAEHLFADLEHHAGTKNGIRHIYFAFVSWGLENTWKYRFIKHCDASPYIGTALREECQARFRPLFLLLEEAVTSGLIKNLPTMLLMNILTGMLEGFIRYLTIHSESVGDKNLWEGTFAALWDALR